MSRRTPVTGWHFDPRDTRQQRHWLRTQRTAQIVRRDFPRGTRIRGRVGGQEGTVERHVPGTGAQGGYLVISWDSGTTGRTGPIAIEQVGS